MGTLISTVAWGSGFGFKSSSFEYYEYLATGFGCEATSEANHLGLLSSFHCWSLEALFDSFELKFGLNDH